MRLPYVCVIAWSFAGALSGCSTPIAPADTGVDAPDSPLATRDMGTDAFVEADIGPMEDTGNDAGIDAADIPDAAMIPDTGPPSPCEAQGSICIHFMPGACAPPNMLDPMHACTNAGDACCIPAAGHAVSCENGGGTCVNIGPGTCLPPSRIGEPELYTCSAGSECCIPPHS